MLYTFDDSDHRDFEIDPDEEKQKLKGSIAFSMKEEEPPVVQLQIDPKKKKGISYKIRERIINVKGSTRKLF